MLEEQLTPNADSSEGTEESNEEAMSENASGGSEEVVDPTQEAIKILQESTGRTYKDIEDAKKHLENLNKFAGNPNLRENADLFDKVVKQYANEQNITPKEAREALKGLVSSSPRETSQSAQVESKSDPRFAELEREVFLSKNPQAEPYVEKIQEYAEIKGVTLKSAYNELYGDILQSVQDDSALDEKRQAKKSAQVIASSSGTAPKGPKKSDRLLKQYQETGDEAIMLEVIKARREEAGGE